MSRALATAWAAAAVMVASAAAHAEERLVPGPKGVPMLLEALGRCVTPPAG